MSICRHRDLLEACAPRLCFYFLTCPSTDQIFEHHLLAMVFRSIEERQLMYSPCHSFGGKKIGCMMSEEIRILAAQEDSEYIHADAKLSRAYTCIHYFSSCTHLKANATQAPDIGLKYTRLETFCEARSSGQIIVASYLTF